MYILSDSLVCGGVSPTGNAVNKWSTGTAGQWDCGDDLWWVCGSSYDFQVCWMQLHCSNYILSKEVRSESQSGSQSHARMKVNQFSQGTREIGAVRLDHPKSRLCRDGLGHRSRTSQHEDRAIGNLSHHVFARHLHTV